MVYSRRRRTYGVRARRRPYRAGRRRYSRRRYMAKRRVRRMPLSGFGTSKTVRMRYRDIITLDAGLAIPALYDFRANSVFDPDVALGGHQPMGFDQWATHYQHYTVIGSKIKVRPIANGGADSVTTPCYYGCVLAAQSSSISGLSVSALLEQRLGRHGVAGNFRQQGTTTQPWVKQYFSARKFFRNRNPTGQSQLSAQVTTNPSELAHFLIWCGGILASDDPSLLHFEVEIDYITVFWEPKQLGPS